MRRLICVLAAAAAGAGCGAAPAGGAGGGGAGGGGGGGGGIGLDDPDPAFTVEERAALRALRYDDRPPPPDASNRMADDPAARRFGQRLFFDPGFSGPLIEGDNDGRGGTLGLRGEAGKVSCAGCHLPESGFVDTRSRGQQISLAAMWTRRRTPTLLEAAFAPLHGWDGRRDSMWSQAIGVIENEREFNSGRLFVAQQLYARHRPEYEAIFGAMPPLDDARRFPPLAPTEAGCRERMTAMGAVYDCRGRPGDGADYDGMAPADQALVTTVVVNAAKALDAYVRLLRCGPSRFDAWLDGDGTALGRAEQRGAALLAGKARCLDCHGGPNLTDHAFHNVGLRPGVVAVAFIDTDDHGAAAGIAGALIDPLNVRGAFSDGDDGRLPAEVTPAMEGAFRTPTLRCLSGQPSFMHTGHLGTLDQVIAFFDRGGDPAGGYPGQSELRRLGLSARERADLAALLGALEGTGPDASLLVPLP
jgi:cytochrome c peroxidase